jgi:hypothetical protein
LTHVKIMVTVNPPPGPTCFATDSDFNFLFACDGTTAITAGTDGRFAIVANRKNIEVATNPGQFYYNVLWKNSSGSAVTVNVAFLRAGVVANGAQAIHAAVFPAPFTGADLAGFNAVNDAIPGGKADGISASPSRRAGPSGSTITSNGAASASSFRLVRRTPAARPIRRGPSAQR